MAPENEALLKFLNVVEREVLCECIDVDHPEAFPQIDQLLHDTRQAIYDGKYDLALGKARECLDFTPDSLKALELQGSAYYLKGDMAKARQAWERVLKTDPDNKIVREFLKQTLKK